MKKKILLLMGVCFLLLCGCAGQSVKAPSAEEGERISLIAIITKPEEYDGVRATVRGVL